MRASSWSESENLKNDQYVGFTAGLAGPYKLAFKDTHADFAIKDMSVISLLNPGPKLNTLVSWEGIFSNDQALIFLLPYQESTQPVYLLLAYEVTTNQHQAPSNNAFTVTLTNGVTVELVGVCKHPSKDKQWWRPDGSLIPRPYDRLNRETRDADYSLYEIVFRLKGEQNLIPKIALNDSVKGSSGPFRIAEQASGISIVEPENVYYTTISVKKGLQLADARGF